MIGRCLRGTLPGRAKSPPARRWLPCASCLNVVRERGHNVGLGHSWNPRSVMFRPADHERA
jgi:hypothetical protein